MQLKRDFYLNDDILAISTKNLSKAYKGSIVLNALNLKVEKNSIFGFLGPNGAGKTTTIKILLSLIKPTAGSAKILGRDIESHSIDIRKKIGYLAQSPRYYGHLTSREVLEFVARFFYKGPQREIQHRINEVLELVGLEQKADRPIRSFSGGEIQRLGIAQAQINYPKILILDEPAASLDPMGRRDVLDIMQRLKKYSTIFFSTHILDDVQRISDSAAILHEGNLIYQGPMEELLSCKGEAIYSARVEGEIGDISKKAARLHWITSYEGKTNDDKTQTLLFKVNNEPLAKKELLRMILESGNINVIEFQKKKYYLEEVFLNLVKGNIN